MNIFESIRKDHERQRELAHQLIDTQGDSQSRRALFSELKKELQIHADAEERHFYIPLFKDDLTQDKARHSVAEHQEIDELIEKLEETDWSSPGWLTYARQLREKVIHHLDEEEHEVFQLAGKVLSQAEKTALAKAYRASMEKQRSA